MQWSAVRVTIFTRDNETFGLKRGYTDPIFVRRPWRKQGLAKGVDCAGVARVARQGHGRSPIVCGCAKPERRAQALREHGLSRAPETFTYRKRLD